MPSVNVSSVVIVALLALVMLMIVVVEVARTLRARLDRNFLGSCGRIHVLEALPPPRDAPLAEAARTLVDHAAIAYTLYCAPPLRKSDWIPPDWTLLAVFNDSTDGRTDGYVLRSPRRDALVVAFRGTYNTTDIGVDIHLQKMDFESVHPKGVGRVHTGFGRRYLNMRKTLLEALRRADLADGATVWVTGHSLGAAVAVLAATDLRLLGHADVRCVAFAPPKVGDLAFGRAAHAALGDDLLLVINTADMVPTSPPGTDFYHASRNILVFYADMGSWRTNHSVTRAYRAALDAPSSTSDSQYSLRLVKRPLAAPSAVGAHG